MKKAIKFDFKTLLVLLLSITLCFTTILAACTKNDDSSSSSSSSSEVKTYPTDTQLLANGDFEFRTFDKEKGSDYPVRSSINWDIRSDSIGSSSAPSNTTYPSGIIDTKDEVYNEIQNVPEVNPRTPEYYKLVDSSAMYSTDDFEAEKDNEDKLPMSGTKILMIHNRTSTSGEGTARKATSDSFTLARNEFAELSVWIKTVDITSMFPEKVAGKDFGAYVALQPTVSSSTSPLILKNVSTDGNWEKYTIYLNSSDFSTSSFKLVLGLGFGSSYVADEFVQGYAFFDNAYLRKLTLKEYTEAIAATDVNEVALYEEKGGLYEEVKAEALVKTQEGVSFKPNFKAGEEAPYEGEYNEEEAKSRYAEVKYSFNLTRANKLTTLGDELLPSSLTAVKNGNKADGTAKVDTLANAYAACGIEDATDKTNKLPVAADSTKALYFNFDKATSYTFSTEAFTLLPDTFVKITFWAKIEISTNPMHNKNALTATLKDLGDGSLTGTDISSTTIIDNEYTNDYENEDYGDWRQYVLFVSNTIDDTTRQFKLEFTFGPDADAIKSNPNLSDWDYAKGYAVMADFEGYYMSENDYSIADTSSYSYAKKIALSADLPNGADDAATEKDSYAFSYSESEAANLAATGKTSTVNGYQLVRANTTPVGGTITDTAQFYGYATDEVDGGLTKNVPTGLRPFGTNNGLLSMFVSAADSTAFGFIGKSATLSANTTTLVSVDVYATNGAIANFYLANPDALDKFTVLSMAPKSCTFDKEDLSYEFGDALFVREFNKTFTGNDGQVGWYTLSLLITTGNESISYRPEFWLGSRDGRTTSSGTVYFDNYSVTTVNEAEKRAELENMGATFGEKQQYTRIPTVVKTNDKNTYTEYKATDVFGVYSFSNFATETDAAKLKSLDVSYFNFTTIDVEHEIDKRTDSSDSTDSSSSSSSSETTNDGTSFNWALQLTSIIIAAVLIVLLIVVFVKMLVDKSKTKKSKSVEYYSRDSREIANTKAEAKRLAAEKKAAEEAEEEPEEYDYDNPEINNNDKLAGAAEEAPVEETSAEETEEPASEDKPEGGDSGDGTDGE